jgi:predicted ATP-grasp superfamily ATP-dependent carboligase
MPQGAALLVMPYLDGVEVSVDVLRTASGLVMLPRYKPGGRHEWMRYDAEILSLCEALMARIPLSVPCNIQFKHHTGHPYLLEINTRMSGGIQLAALASEVNIPNIAINQLLDVEKTWRINRREVDLSYIETPLILQAKSAL